MVPPPPSTTEVGLGVVEGFGVDAGQRLVEFQRIEQHRAAYKIALFTHLYQQRD